MKLVVFSDAHGNKEIIKRIIEYNPDADYVISLGDSELTNRFLTDLDIVAIKGNYPRDGGFIFESIMKVEDKKIFMTHGHKYGVSNDMKKLLAKGMKEEVDLVLYGHTHIPKVDKVTGIFYINPGSISNQRTDVKASYLEIFIEKGKDISFKFRESETNLVMDNIYRIK